MDGNVCRNCGSLLIGDVCKKCGYNANLKNPFTNIISSRQAKEDVGDKIIAFLANNKHINIEKDLKLSTIQFGYLFLNNGNEYESLLKVVIPQKLFSPKKIFYIALQKGNLILLNNNFNETTFKKVSQDMLYMHKVDFNEINNADYFMQLR